MAVPVKLLIVDDDVDTLQTLRDFATAQGFTPIIALNAGEAITAVRVDPEVKLVLTDYLMPGRNGIELARALFALRSDLVILLHADPDIYLRLMSVAMAVGIKKVLEKGDHYWLRDELDAARALLVE